MSLDNFGNYVCTLPYAGPNLPNTGPVAQQMYNGAFDDPNGNVMPADVTLPAIYIKDQSNPVEMWSWSVSNANWFPMITP